MDMSETIKVLERRSTIEIVPLSEKYLVGAVQIAREMHANSIYHDMPLDLEKTFTQLASCGTVVPDRYFKIAVRGDDVLGGFYGHVTKTFFCDELLASDLGWWVTKSHRGSAAAVLLLADFERWARAKGARKVMVGQSSAINMEATRRLYEHCGFRMIGVNTVKDL